MRSRSLLNIGYHPLYLIKEVLVFSPIDNILCWFKSRYSSPCYLLRIHLYPKYGDSCCLESVRGAITFSPSDCQSRAMAIAGIPGVYTAQANLGFSMYRQLEIALFSPSLLSNGRDPYS